MTSTIPDSTTTAPPLTLPGTEAADHGRANAQPFAQVWTGGSVFELRTFDRPRLAPGESLVRLTAATVCGSDRHTVSGRRSGACPSVLGHEGVGIVEETRGNVPVGSRVVFSVTSVCGRCRNCRRGLSAKCTSVRKVGHESAESDWALSGTYASHIHLPSGVAMVPVPDSLPDGVAATAGCAVATVMAMVEAAGDFSGRRVFVNGIGMLGLTAVGAALARGAAEVIAADPHPDRRGLADRAGATRSVEPGTEIDDVDVALELSGTEAGVRSCIDSLGIGGTVVLAGSVTPGPQLSIDPEQMVRGWRTITGVHNFEPHHLAEAVDFLAADGAALPWEDILGGPVPLTDLPHEFRAPTKALRTITTP
ncbi:putative phosphonate catabolism associated alcohol dehydrogenase [Brevibacterium siliguriense]|uniref:alcohol dehydrogenase n=1 Tax=Brevibacterium siliguriense TaxID=1136497 RepID=A0A1H1M311_9MICO|nr:alcohol dehydrogenase catalytic domain-containing protein [Brevibacterium siliguriense]SDR81193.1 putative phosphonate catabolism associated alcohol dehydrogenase [Brevibacterium siliguriense]